ncbi:hypothetical protein DRQ15_07730 [candidate division KSB1 bacterium]|nr:DUF433 domain-containing protein [bacterium]RKY90304.1 MAG: hypothetical protein DRQ15_07730 [candidate division KSB1 bacterium]
MPVSINEKVMHGEPVVAGTRVPVKVVLGSLAAGMSFEEVMEEYDITYQDILDCLDYAARTVAEEEVHLLRA